MQSNTRVDPTGLSPAHIGGRTRFVVGFVAEALSRSRPAGDAEAVRGPGDHVERKA